MQRTERGSGSHPTADARHVSDERHLLAGIEVREEDIEPVKGIRALAILFRGMAILLLLLMLAQLVIGLSGTVPVSIGVLLAEAVRLLIFAGLLWAIGDLAVLWVKSHHDIRATRILTARILYLLRDSAESRGAGGPASPAGGSHADRRP